MPKKIVWDPVFTAWCWIALEVDPTAFKKAFEKRFPDGIAIHLEHVPSFARPTNVHERAACFEIALSLKKKQAFILFLERTGKPHGLEVRELPGFNLGLFLP